jgi:hypothetical protein
MISSAAEDENKKKIKAKSLKTSLKTSLNAYSFNRPLLDGTVSIGELIEFCADTGFEGIDITAYYFKGYPQVPPDEYLFDIKRKAFKAGLEITGTGVRNDFTIADKTKRDQEVQLVKNWIEACFKNWGLCFKNIFRDTKKRRHTQRAGNRMDAEGYTDMC